MASYPCCSLCVSRGICCYGSNRRPSAACLKRPETLKRLTQRSVVQLPLLHQHAAISHCGPHPLFKHRSPIRDRQSSTCAAVHSEREMSLNRSSRCASSWREGIRVFHCETGLSNLRRVRRGDAGELRPDVVDDVKVTVGSVVVSQAKIGAHRLRVRRIHLNETCESQKTSKGIICLQAGQCYRKLPVQQRHSKAIPCLGSGDRKLLGCPVVGLRTKFVQGPGVIAAKAFKEIVGEPAILARSVRKLMAGEPIQPVRNEDIFVDMKERCDSLRKNICGIV